MTPLVRRRAKTAGAFTIGGLIAAATTLGSVQRLVYTRQEGRLLESRLDHVEQNYREDVREVRESLERIVKSLKRP